MLKSKENEIERSHELLTFTSFGCISKFSNLKRFSFKIKIHNNSLIFYKELQI